MDLTSMVFGPCAAIFLARFQLVTRRRRQKNRMVLAASVSMELWKFPVAKKSYSLDTGSAAKKSYSLDPGSGPEIAKMSNQVFQVETMKVGSNLRRLPQEALDMFGAALGVAGNLDSMRFDSMQSTFNPEVYSPNPVNMMLLHQVFPFISDMKITSSQHTSGISSRGVHWTAVVIDCPEMGKRCFLLKGFKPCRLFAMGVFAPMFITTHMPQDRISQMTVTHVFSGCCSFCGSAGDKFLYCSACKAKGFTAQYCNATCQHADWKDHKKKCFAKRI